MMKGNEDNPDQTEICIINPLIWKRSGLPRNEFLKRVRSAQAIRIREWNWIYERLPRFSYFPSSLDLWTQLERLHHLVNDGDFSVFDERVEDRVFAVILPPRFATWLLRTKVATLQSQIIHWLAAYSTFRGKLPSEQVTELPPGIKEQVEVIKRKYFGTGFSHEELWETHYPERPAELLKHYENTAKAVTGSAPPEILKLRECDFDTVDLSAWGLNRGQFGGWPGFTFQYSYAYFRPDDWERIVEKSECDDLVRAESSQDWWQKWLHTFELYPKRGSLVFNAVADEVQTGYVYLFHDEHKGAYKIGFHAGSDPYGRRGSLQTGNPDPLLPVGNFRVSSKKTETVLHQFFAGKRVRSDGEWFALTKEDIANILDEGWRIRNNIF